jgi:long-chain acyl-CoA synthetase
VKRTPSSSSGEKTSNRSPLRLAYSKSEYIEQAMVVGQDKKFLGALIVPNMELLEKFAHGERNFLLGT